VPDSRNLLFQGKAQPVQLTSGPLDYLSPLPSKDGKHVFAIGVLKRAELVRRDTRSGQFSPFLSGISAGEVEFSRDGQWVTYVSYPENTLWRSRADGSDRLQLTYAPWWVIQPHWSPDGKRIAFTRVMPSQTWRIYIVPVDGGVPEPLLMEQRSQFAPTWAPDGGSIAFSRIFFRESGNTIQVFNLKTGKVSELPGSNELWYPTWSLDGEYLTALSRDQRRLMIYNFASGKWFEAWKGSGISYVNFSRDSKFVYFENQTDRTVHRLSVSDLRSEQVADLKELRRPSMPYWPFWIGLAADDSLLAMRDVETQEIYALDLQP